MLITTERPAAPQPQVVGTPQRKSQERGEGERGVASQEEFSSVEPDGRKMRGECRCSSPRWACELCTISHTGTNGLM